jgi:Rrf2 family protein
MRISAKAEYACAAMLELAARYGSPQPVRIKAIADAQGGISDRFLVQILLQLKTAGLVVSVRGAAGGYHLARPPETITLAHIINAVENRTPEPPALKGFPRTPVVEVVLGVWQEIQAQEQRYLEQLTLAELLRRTQAMDNLSYVI